MQGQVLTGDEHIESENAFGNHSSGETTVYFLFLFGIDLQIDEPAHRGILLRQEQFFHVLLNAFIGEFF
jgi:hypothetical protein